MNLYAVNERMARQRSQSTFLKGDGETISYAEFHRRVGRSAATLAALGVGRGDRVASILHNRVLGLELMYACAWLGAIWSPVNWRLAVAEWGFILNDLEPTVVVVEDDLLADVDKLGGGWTLFAVDAPSERAWTARTSAERAPDPPLAPVRLDEPARIMYTSGTTAHPKGVILSHGNILFKNAAYEREFDLRPDDVVLMMGPMFHVGGLDAPGVAIVNQGGTLVVLPTFEPSLVLETIEREGVTVLWSAPTMTEMILAAADELPGAATASVRVVLTGSSQSSPDLLGRATTAFPNAVIADGYGMTETASGSLFIDVRSHPEKAGAVGSIDRPVMYERMRVVDAEGRDVETGEPGEILVSGGKLFQGYWRNEQATRETLDEEGWFHTGDIGLLDEDRFLYVVDRQKDMIKSGGENIGSLEIERVVGAIDGVESAAAVAAPDEKWGEVPAVFVEALPGSSVDAELVRERCRSNLAKFKVPKYVHIVDSVPRTPSGKARKGELRKLAAELAGRPEVQA